MAKNEFKRLTKSIKPTHYNIEITADLEKFTTRGFIHIDLQILSCNLQKITLHCSEIDFDCVQLVQNDETVLDPKYTFNAPEETVELVFEQPIARGRSRLDISYTGILNDKLIGFYRSRYLDPDGSEKYEAVTQFAAIAARKCFPCWDEPDFKATFDLTIIADSKFTVLSNMPIIRCSCKGPTRKILFDTSPVMSTYLLAIVIGEYDFVEDITSAGVVLKVYTAVSKSEQGNFALTISKNALDFYESYFQIPFPLPKLDLIAVRNFSAGAMENWGLITYRETTLLIDPKRSGVNDKIRVAGVVCHELAHMWFGNLVTMAWWDDLWLNEGYASFVQYMAADYVIPEYNFWTLFITNAMAVGFDLDALTNSHPIQVPVDNPNQIDELFDAITYRKGASVIRMLHYYIGEKDFQAGMRLYLHRNQYQNTKTSDLWQVLEEASNKPVGTVMSTWTKQTGFPFITVEEQQVNQDRVLHLTQSKFCSDGKPDPNNTLWKIPITICASKNPSDVIQNVLFEDEHLEIKVPNICEKDWVKLNCGTVGFYRVLYQYETSQKFKQSILDQSMPPADRIGVLTDLFAMVKAGYRPSVDILDMMLAFKNETNNAVWSCIHTTISYLEKILSHTPVVEKFHNYVQSLLENIYKRVGWTIKPGESDLDHLTRSIVLQLLVGSEHAQCVEIAKGKFKCMLKGSSEMQGDFKSIVYRAVAMHATQEDYLSLLNLYKTSQSAEDRSKILMVLGATNNKEIQQQALDLCMSEEVKAQDVIYCLKSVVSTPSGAELAWNYFVMHCTEILSKYPKGDYILKHVIALITYNFVTSEKAAEIEAFFQEYPVPGVERTVRQSVEAILINDMFLQRDLSAIESFLK